MGALDVIEALQTARESMSGRAYLVLCLTCSEEKEGGAADYKHPDRVTCRGCESDDVVVFKIRARQPGGLKPMRAR